MTGILDCLFHFSSVWVSMMGVAVKYSKAGGIPVVFIILARTIMGIVLALTVCAAQGINPLGTQRKVSSRIPFDFT